METLKKKTLWARLMGALFRPVYDSHTPIVTTTWLAKKKPKTKRIIYKNKHFTK